MLKTTDLIPARTQTYSKGPAQFPEACPRYALSGQGGHITLSDGETYIDWLMGLGAFPLGYRDKDVDSAIGAQLLRGTEFSLPNQLEEEVAQQIVDLVPDVEQVRFAKNGSDVCAAAVRAARALTGREKVISIGYHGWMVDCPNANGVPASESVLVWKHWADASRDAACLIIEPDHHACAELSQMREWCNLNGVVLVFDEVVTGVRWRTGSITKDSGISPDLICLGKAISNGMPLSAIAGLAKFMEPFGGGIGFSMTHSGECLSLAAAQVTLAKVDDQVRGYIWSVGRQMLRGFNGLAREFGLPLRAAGSPCRVVIEWPEDRVWRTAVQEMLLHDGVLLAYGFLPCAAHDERDIELTLRALRRCFNELSANGPKPKGRLVGESYRGWAA